MSYISEVVEQQMLLQSMLQANEKYWIVLLASDLSSYYFFCSDQLYNNQSACGSVDGCLLLCFTYKCILLQSNYCHLFLFFSSDSYGDAQLTLKRVTQCDFAIGTKKIQANECFNITRGKIFSVKIKVM